MADFIFLGSKITADGDCSHEIKRCLLLGKKVMTNLDGMLKSRDNTLPTKVRLVKAVVFPVILLCLALSPLPGLLCPVVLVLSPYLVYLRVLPRVLVSQPRWVPVKALVGGLPRTLR